MTRTTLANRTLMVALLTGVAALAAAATAPPPHRAILPAPDGTFLVEETGSVAGAFRFAHVTADGSLLDEVSIASKLGRPVAGSLEDPRAAWFRTDDEKTGRIELSLVREDGTILRTQIVAPAMGPDGKPDGRVSVDVSPSGLWAILRTIPASAPSQLEWWNLMDGNRMPVLVPNSSYDLGLRRQTLDVAVIHPAWLQRFLLSAPKDRFSDVLAELASGCNASLPWAIPDTDRVLAAHPVDDGLALFLVERNDEAPAATAAVRDGGPRGTATRSFHVITYDMAGHVLRTEDVGKLAANLDLATRTVSFSRDGSRLLVGGVDADVVSIDLVGGRRDRFTVHTPLPGEKWADAQARAGLPSLYYQAPAAD